MARIIVEVAGVRVVWDDLGTDQAAILLQTFVQHIGPATSKTEDRDRDLKIKALIEDLAAGLDGESWRVIEGYLDEFADKLKEML